MQPFISELFRRVKRVSPRTKHLCILLGAQAGCLVVALWMQHYYVSSLVRAAVRDEDWTDLTIEARRALRELDALDTPALKLSGTPPTPLNAVLAAARHHDVNHITLLDEHWQVVLTVHAVPSADPTSLTEGETVVLARSTRYRATGTGQGGPRRGTIEMSDGVHLAVAIARRDGRGFVVAHRPGQDVAAREAFVSANLPAASAMTLAWTLALLGIITYLVESRVHDRFARNREQRDAASLRRMQSLVRTRDAVVFGLAKLAESRDPETGDHLERIGIYSSTLAEALRHVPRYANEVNQSFVRLIRVVSVLHDIGKVGVPDSILLKPGALSKEERSEMQRHTSVGGECIREIEQRLGSSNFLEMAREIAFAHHEQWDGSGYPLGLVGEEIPLSARIVAIVDVYDALASRRVYKTAMPHEECLARIRLGAGTQFDPKLLDVWLSIESQFKAIAIQYAWDRSAYSDPPSPATPRKADHAIGTARES